ncbi:hypothetical protein PQ455_10565 [Sphingomonas naphthae]|uniref:Uncharacterized protein n=1 Tax=Sphingomonas naphthae TaxID=1813468 RepID=A0ABY7TID0_9SPHN|nr:hypothetical protein [Sphingomonas naphthae]WCT72089.1 hypothetical protein PQ455_10565 [Sphingomonas naphthae]
MPFNPGPPPIFGSLQNLLSPNTRFGREAVRDPRFVFDLRNGREPGRKVRDKVRTFITSAPPVTRPARREAR